MKTLSKIKKGVKNTKILSMLKCFTLDNNKTNGVTGSSGACDVEWTETIKQTWLSANKKYDLLWDYHSHATNTPQD